MMPCSPPPGFDRHNRGSPLTDPWEPIYCNQEGGIVRLGLMVGAQHTNSRGLVHGGLIAALADNAMGLSCLRAVGASGLVTVSLAVDYLEPACQDQWLEFKATVARAGKLLSFATAVVLTNGKLCAQSRGTYRAINRTAASNHGVTESR